MSHSYSSNRVHLIFSTKGRERRIPDALQVQLWPYMAGIARNHGFEAIQIGGVSDHVQALLILPPTIPLAKAVQILKACSSKWLDDTQVAGAAFAWQEGYEAFSVSASQTPEVVKYIVGQKSHHASRNYEDEFRDFLRKYGVEHDPDWVLG